MKSEKDIEGLFIGACLLDSNFNNGIFVKNFNGCYIRQCVCYNLRGICD